MTGIAQLVAACIIGLASGTGFIVNEATHGAMAEGIGFGHHHMSDVGGYHCTSHDSAKHVQHMHNQTMTDHSHCTGGGTMHNDGQNHSHGGMHDA